MAAPSSISALKSESGASFDTQLTPIFKEHPVIFTRLPASRMEIGETTTVCFSNVETLKKSLMQPIAVDEEVVKKVITKFTTLVGSGLYPSEIARLLFELAFTDFEGIRLTPKQRTDNMAYILSNLGSGRADIAKDLFAFYYGYSFEQFAPKKS